MSWENTIPETPPSTTPTADGRFDRYHYDLLPEKDEHGGPLYATSLATSIGRTLNPFEQLRGMKVKYGTTKEKSIVPTCEQFQFPTKKMRSGGYTVEACDDPTFEFWPDPLMPEAPKGL